MQLGAWTPPLSHLSTTIIRLLLPGCGGVSHRQPESGGSPISFVHFSPSFSAEPFLPPGRVHPVPVLLRLDSTEATEMKSLEVDANNFPQPGLCVSHIYEQNNSYWVCVTLFQPCNHQTVLFLLLTCFSSVAKKPASILLHEKTNKTYIWSWDRKLLIGSGTSTYPKNISRNSQGPRLHLE